MHILFDVCVCTFLFDVCVCMSVLWPDLMNGLHVRGVLKCEFAYDRVCLEMTLCSLQDVKIQVLTN